MFPDLTELHFTLRDTPSTASNIVPFFKQRQNLRTLRLLKLSAAVSGASAVPNGALLVDGLDDMADLWEELGHQDDSHR